MAWSNLTEVREEWLDAPDDDDVLQRYLDAAHEACVAYAPALGEGDPVPEGYKMAEAQQARAIYRSLTAGRSDDYGNDDIAVTVFPLDWNIRQLLRPRRVRGLQVR